MRAKRLGAALCLGSLAVALTACSQISSLTPVGGASITTVRNATNNVLVDQQVPILIAPKCEANSGGFTCRGTTVDDDPIVAEASGDAPFDLTISIGGEVIFTGTAQEVLDEAVLEAS